MAVLVVSGKRQPVVLLSGFSVVFPHSLHVLQSLDKPMNEQGMLFLLRLLHNSGIIFKAILLPLKN
jgi:hypothetical protein